MFGRFNKLRRKDKDEDANASAYLKSRWTWLRLASAMSADLLADRLLVMAVENLSGDPFLRDAFTRGLERLGPAGIEAVVKGLGSDDPKRSEAALFILQGWRAKDGLDALMVEATTEKKIPTNARVGMFRALREMGEAVAPEPIARWIVAAKDADSGGEGRGDQGAVGDEGEGDQRDGGDPAGPAG